MITLKGKTVYLRALEKSDLNYLFKLENDEEVWEVSDTITPYSKHVLQQYLDNALRDIYEVKQLRLVICEQETDAVIGFIDLYDFNPKNSRAGVGVIVYDKNKRGQGKGKEALELLIKYSFDKLALHQIYATIGEDNKASIKLFETLGFVNTGVKKDWNCVSGVYKDELVYQKIK